MTEDMEEKFYISVKYPVKVDKDGEMNEIDFNKKQDKIINGIHDLIEKLGGEVLDIEIK